MNGDKFTFIDLFAGIGGMRIAFEHIGGTCVFSSEWDEAAQRTYEANFGERPAGDITKIPNDEIPKHDVLLAGFPCQPFSIIGNKKGFSDTRGTLFFEIERILSHLINILVFTVNRAGVVILSLAAEIVADIGSALTRILHCFRFRGS